MTSINKLFDEQAKHYNKLYYGDNSHIQETKAIVKIFRSHKKLNIRTILDVGCGTALHAHELFRHGYTVTCLDISRSMLAIARKELSQYNARFFEADISKWNSKGEKFDAVMSLFQTLSYLPKANSFVNSIRNIYNALKDGGLFIFDVVNGLWAYRNFEPIYTTEVKDGVMIWKRELDEVEDMLVAKGLFYIKGRRMEDLQYFKLFTGPELEMILKSIGFRTVHYYCNSWSLNPYSSRSPNLHIVAVR